MRAVLLLLILYTTAIAALNSAPLPSRGRVQHQLRREKHGSIEDVAE